MQEFSTSFRSKFFQYMTVHVFIDQDTSHPRDLHHRSAGNTVHSDRNPTHLIWRTQCFPNDLWLLLTKKVNYLDMRLHNHFCRSSIRPTYLDSHTSSELLGWFPLYPEPSRWANLSILLGGSGDVLEFNFLFLNRIRVAIRFITAPYESRFQL